MTEAPLVAPVNGPPFGQAIPDDRPCQARSNRGQCLETAGGEGVPLKCAGGVTRGVSSTGFGRQEPRNFFTPAKPCSKCGMVKPRSLDAFPADGRKADGLRADCRVCFSAVRVARYAKLAGADYVPRTTRGRPKASKVGRYVPHDAKAEKAKHRAAERASPARKMTRRLRDRVRAALGPIPRGHYSLGCTPAELKAHIERQFLKGMSWENRGRWHIDHIRPLAAFDLTDPEQLRAACSFTNLQPLWARDNLAKGAKLEVML